MDDDGIRVFRGVIVATVLSIPVWALILWALL